MKPDKISSEDLFVLQDAKRNMAYAKLLREKAETQVQLSVSEENTATLNHRNLLLTVYLKHGLRMEDKIEADGTITYYVEPEEASKTAKPKKESK